MTQNSEDLKEKTEYDWLDKNNLKKFLCRKNQDGSIG